MKHTDMENCERQREAYRGYLIKIVYDDYPFSPRENDNVCTMNCYLNGYSLGDNECNGDPCSDLRDLIIKNVSPNEFISLANQCRRIKVDDQEDPNAYTLYEFFFNEWHIVGDYRKDDKYEMEKIMADAVQLMDAPDLFEILDDCNELAISYLYAYIHSGITISMSRGGQFSDSFDSGCLGFIYVTKKKMLEEFSDLTDDNWEQKAFSVMGAEVKEYDDYLTGECYGWEVYAPVGDPEDEEWENVSEDSCYGFIGDDIEFLIDEAKSAIDHTIEQKEKRKAEAEKETERKRWELFDSLEELVGEEFVIGNAVYGVNRDNLFSCPQIYKKEIENGKVLPPACVKMPDVDGTVVNALYSHVNTHI